MASGCAPYCHESSLPLPTASPRGVSPCPGTWASSACAPVLFLRLFGSPSSSSHIGAYARFPRVLSYFLDTSIFSFSSYLSRVCCVWSTAWACGKVQARSYRTLGITAGSSLGDSLWAIHCAALRALSHSIPTLIPRGASIVLSPQTAGRGTGRRRNLPKVRTGFWQSHTRALPAHP